MIKFLFLQGSVMACEYLILNASDINIQDDHGQTPLFFATQLGIFSYFVLLVLLFSLDISCK